MRACPPRELDRVDRCPDTVDDVDPTPVLAGHPELTAAGRRRSLRADCEDGGGNNDQTAGLYPGIHFLPPLSTVRTTACWTRGCSAARSENELGRVGDAASRLRERRDADPARELPSIDARAHDLDRVRPERRRERHVPQVDVRQCFEVGRHIEVDVETRIRV